VLLRRIAELADKAIFGSLSETYRTCGNPGCRCHHDGPKHGPHLSASYHSEGKTTGFHVPAMAQAEVRAGVEAWHALQNCVKELAEMNKECVLAKTRRKVAQ